VTPLVDADTIAESPWTYVIAGGGSWPPPAISLCVRMAFHREVVLDRGHARRRPGSGLCGVPLGPRVHAPAQSHLSILCLYADLLGFHFGASLQCGSDRRRTR
jgi:hypothetical protein